MLGILRQPDEAAANLWKKIKRIDKIAFFSTIIIGLLCHLYVLTNTLPNHDSMYSFYHDQNILYLGRWFLGVACAPSSYFDLPLVIAVLTLFYYGLISVVLVHLFDIQKPLTAILLSAVLVTFPTVAATFSYMYTADGYAMAFLFSVAGVLALQRLHNWKGILASVVLFTLCLGIYQSYLSVAMVLIILLLALALTKKDTTIKQVLVFAFRCLLSGAISFIAYYAILQICLRVQGVSLASYQGVESLNNFSVLKETFFPQLLQTFAEVPLFFTAKSPYNSPKMLIVIVATFVLLLAILIVGIIRAGLADKSKPRESLLWRLVAFIFLLLAISPATNFVILMGSATRMHMLMYSAYCLLLLSVLIFSELVTSDINLIRWGAIVLSFILFFHGFLVSNIAYFNMHQRYEKSYALAVRLVDRFEQTPGYYPGITFMFVGNTPEGLPETNGTDDHITGMSGTTGNHILTTDTHYRTFIYHYIGMPYFHPGDEQREAILASESFQEMDIWPAENSVKIIGDILVVRFE